MNFLLGCSAKNPEYLLHSNVIKASISRDVRVIIIIKIWYILYNNHDNIPLYTLHYHYDIIMVYHNIPWYTMLYHNIL